MRHRGLPTYTFVHAVCCPSWCDLFAQERAQLAVQMNAEAVQRIFGREMDAEAPNCLGSYGAPGDFLGILGGLQGSNDLRSVNDGIWCYLMVSGSPDPGAVGSFSTGARLPWWHWSSLPGLSKAAGSSWAGWRCHSAKFALRFEDSIRSCNWSSYSGLDGYDENRPSTAMLIDIVTKAVLHS